MRKIEGKKKAESTYLTNLVDWFRLFRIICDASQQKVPYVGQAYLEILKQISLENYKENNKK